MKSIRSFMHCGRCIQEVPEGQSPQEWSRLEVGWTPKGLQVWCVRHNCNVVALDFMGQKIDYDDDAHIQAH